MPDFDQENSENLLYTPPRISAPIGALEPSQIAKPASLGQSNIELLARKVYELLRDELRVQRERITVRR